MVGGYCGTREEDAGFGAGGGDAGVFVVGRGGGEVRWVVVLVAGGVVSLHFCLEELMDKVLEVLSFLGPLWVLLWWVLLRRGQVRSACVNHSAEKSHR